MPSWMTPMLSGTLGTTALTLLALALLPALSRRYRQRTLYGLLVICLLGFLIPWRPQLTPKPAVTVALRADTAQRLRPLLRAAEPVAAAPDAAPAPAAVAQPADGAPSARPISSRLVLALVWAAGAAGVLGLALLRYFRFTRLLTRWREAPDAALATLLAQETRAAGLRRAPMLWLAPCVTGPLVTGLLCPAVYLPPDAVGDVDLRLILRHELTHLRQGDLPVKWLALAACAMHWFNPAVWLLRRALAQQCELSCDELVMSGSSLAERVRYSEALIAAIRGRTQPPTALCTAFQGGLERMKRRITQIMDIRQKHIGALVALILVCLTVLTGSLLTVSATAQPDGLPDFPSDYDRELEETVFFDAPVAGYTSGAAAPAYNMGDDPGWPAAFYVPGVPLTVTAMQWRAEHIEGVMGEGGMVWLTVNIGLGEALKGVCVPAAFVTIGGDAPASNVTGTVRPADGAGFAYVYSRLNDKTPSGTLPAGETVTLISYQPEWAQIMLGSVTGYVKLDDISLSPDTLAVFRPAWMDGFDSHRLGYESYYAQYYDWFEQMENQYGSMDFWDNGMRAMASDMALAFGLVQPGDTVFILPEAGGITEQEAIAIGRRLIGDDGQTDALGVPYYAWQAYMVRHYQQDDAPFWQLRAWATHTDMTRKNLQLTTDGALIGEIATYRDNPDPVSPYDEIALSVLYGEDQTAWPKAVRTAYDPEGHPPLREGWLTEEEIIAKAWALLEEEYGADRRAAVEAAFTVSADYYNYGQFDENDKEDRIFWTVRFVCLTPGQVEEIKAMINMDGTPRGPLVDDFYGDLPNYTPGGNG